jgi:transcriptional regulator with XRE-family HTH domain
MSRSPSEGSAKTGSEALAQLIKGRREALGMSRQELADATGVPYPTIAQIETAYRGVSPSRLGVIARALGLDPAQLYDVLASDPGAAPPAKPARRGRPAARVRSTGEGEWLANPAYATSAPMLAGSAPLAAEAPPLDVVDEVVALLSGLPAQERLDALARVQSRLLSGVVQEEVRRATKGSRKS